MDRVRQCCYLILDNYVHPSPFLRNHTCIDTLNMYINLKEGLALLVLVPRYMQRSYKKKKRREQSRHGSAQLFSWGWGRFSSQAFQPLRLTVSDIVAAAGVVIVIVTSFPLHRCRVIPPPSRHFPFSALFPPLLLLFVISPLLLFIISPLLLFVILPLLLIVSPLLDSSPLPRPSSSPSTLLLGSTRRWVRLPVMYCHCRCRCCCCRLSSVAAKCWVVLILSDGSMEEGWEKMGHDKYHGPFSRCTMRASDFMGSLLLSFLPNSSIARE